MVGRLNDEPGITAANVYQFKVNDSKENVTYMRNYKGKVLLIVNVASQSGFADLNYRELHCLQKVYGDRQFRVLIFPCDQFGNQEPFQGEDIRLWAEEKGYDFDIFAKIDVNGPKTPLLWRYLKTSCRGMMGDFIKWNFTKFLVDRKGVPVGRFGPAVPPSKLANTIEILLNSTCE